MRSKKGKPFLTFPFVLWLALNSDLTQLSNNTLRFPDLTNVIKASTAVTSTGTYTATQDCWANVQLESYNGTSVYAKVDNVFIAHASSTVNMHCGNSAMIPLKAGQVLTVTGNTSFASYYSIYGCM